MKILDPQSAVLSNAEVLNHLQSIQSRRRAQVGHRGVPPLKSPNFETVVRELKAYLQPAQATPLPSYATDYDSYSIRRTVNLLGKFELTRAEMLMILNLRPDNTPRLYAIIEEVDMRLSAEQQDEVLKIIKECLPRKTEK